MRFDNHLGFVGLLLSQWKERRGNVREHDREHDIVFAGHMMQNIYARRIYREKS